MKGTKNNEASKIILTLIIALLVFFHFYHYEYLFKAAIILGLIGILSEYLSKKIAYAWMLLAGLLGKVMPKVVLSLVYFLFFVPYAFVYRLIKKDPLNMRSEGKTTFYKKRDHLYTPSDLENPW